MGLEIMIGWGSCLDMNQNEPNSFKIQHLLKPVGEELNTLSDSMLLDTTGTPWHGTDPETQTFMARPGTENLGTEHLGAARHGKYWHGKTLARHGIKHLDFGTNYFL